MENNLIPFDLEKAKAGKPVVTRDGRNVTEMFFPKIFFNWFTFIAIIDNDIISYHKNGSYNNYNESDYDLFMAEEEMYVVVFKDGSIFLYNELNRAKAYARNLANCKGTYKLVKI